MELTLATLMAPSADEPDGLYGSPREPGRFGRRSELPTRFLLRPQAKFHDGSRITAQDVAFSLGSFEGEGPPDHPPAQRATW